MGLLDGLQLPSFLSLPDGGAGGASGGAPGGGGIDPRWIYALATALPAIGQSMQPSRLPRSGIGDAFTIAGSGLGGYLTGDAQIQRNALQAEQLKQAQQQNQLGALNLSGYQRLAALRGGAAGGGGGGYTGAAPSVGATGALAQNAAAPFGPSGPFGSDMMSPALGPGDVPPQVSAGKPAIPQLAPGMLSGGGVPTVGPLNLGGPVSFGGALPFGGVPGGAPGAGRGGAPVGPPPMGGGAPGGGSGGGGAEPLFNVPDLKAQYQILSTMPAGAGQAAQILQLIERGTPEGAYIGTDGGVYSRPHYNDYLAQKGFATGYGTSQGQLPADLSKIGYQGQVDVAKAGPIARAQAAGAFPYDVAKTDLSQQGAARFTFQEARDPVTGQTYQIPSIDAYRVAGAPFFNNGAAGGGAAPPPASSRYSGVSPRIGATGALSPSAVDLAALPQLAAPGQAGPRFPGLPGKLELSPEQQAASSGLGDIDKQITANGQKADQVLGRLDVVSNAAQSFRTGTTADARLAGAKALVDGLGALGFKVPDLQRYVASGETLDKEGGYLAAEMTRALGSREAASVFNQVRAIQPGIKLSEGGLEAITNSIRWGVIRDKDLMNFRDQWLSNPANGGSIRGMQQAFDRTYPVELYASRVIPYPMPADRSKLLPNVVYRLGDGRPAVFNGRGFQVQQ